MQEGSRRFLRVLAPLALAFALAGPHGACSLLLNDDVTQCRTDADCARFPNAVCNLVTNLCVRRWDSPNPGVDSGTMDSASSGNADAVSAVGGHAGGGGAGQPFGSTGGAMGMTIPDGGTANPADGSPPERGPVAECPDLNHNGVLDCKETLVANPDFGMGISGWTPELNVAQSFLPNDAEGLSASGCISITNASQSDAMGSLVGGSWQCIPAVGAASYDFYVEALVPVDQGLGTSAGAAFQFFATPNCVAPMNSSYALPFVDPLPKGWFLIQGTIPAPPGAQSMAVRLVILKPLRQQPTQVLFDNVLLKLK